MPAVERLLCYESPSQHSARLAPADRDLGGKSINQRAAVIAVVGAANRDPERFPDPDRLDLGRQYNRRMVFAWGSHFCLGRPRPVSRARSWSPPCCTECPSST